MNEDFKTGIAVGIMGTLLFALVVAVGVYLTLPRPQPVTASEINAGITAAMKYAHDNNLDAEPQPSLEPGTHQVVSVVTTGDVTLSGPARFFKGPGVCQIVFDQDIDHPIFVDGVTDRVRFPWRKDAKLANLKCAGM